MSRWPEVLLQMTFDKSEYLKVSLKQRKNEAMTCSDFRRQVFDCSQGTKECP